MIQINCPKCNAVLTMPNKYTYEGGCPRCGAAFRIRNGKTYEQSQIANNVLYSLTVLFAAIAREDAENKDQYFLYANKFIESQPLTKLQHNDLTKTFKDEYKGFFHSNYKKIISELKLATDESYKAISLSEQQNFEEKMFSLLCDFAFYTKKVNEQQNQILSTFCTIFEFSEERKNKILSQFMKPQQKKENSDIDNSLSKIQTLLINEFPFQEFFIKNLIISFKRPFISPPQKSYKNLAVILTAETDLICDILNNFSKKLNEEVITFNKISYIDCSNFSDETSLNAFVLELENATHSNNEIITLKNFSALSNQGIAIISKIFANGSINLNSREITGNNKYFFIITSSSQEELQSVIGEQFINSINDLIKLEELKPEDILNLTQNIVNNFIYNTRQELQMNLFYDPVIIDFIKDTYNKNLGMKSVKIYIEHNIHKPLIEYKLKRNPDSESKIILTLYEEKLSLVENNQAISLEKLLPKKQNANLDEIKEKLNKIIGLDPVKEYVLKLEDNVLAQKMREESGLKNSSVSMNMIFTGNPGTGKTTIARIVAEYLKALGVISTGQLIETSRNDLVGEYQGQTAQKTAAKINSALGGVLFIDEAYALCRNNNDSFGLEAIDTLVKMMEDNKNNLVVILAGYSAEMKEFLRNNSGLKSRFPNIIDFPDYSPKEMYQIASTIAKANDYTIDPQCIEPLINYFEVKNVKGKNDSGNGRLARNTVENAIINQSKRIIHENDVDYQTLKLVDFEIKEKEEFDLESKLKDIVGLEEVKNYIRSLAAKIKINKQREKMGIMTNNVQTLHMIFKGNPGTGKTMMARTVADLLYNLNVISTNNLVETDRAGLVAGYVGQTAQKTTDKVFEAINGVLFIDEAYTLSQGGENDFGHEAIDTLVKLMDDNRDRLVVILAGYSDNMQQFLDVNPGLQSRFPNIVEFSDYTLEQLMEIATNLFTKNGFELSNEAMIKLENILEEVRHDSRFGNGRYIRNIFERATTKQAMRISLLTEELTKELLVTILPEDIEKL